MADMPLQPLQTVKPEDLGALIAQAEKERWTELILLGPSYGLGDDRERWPERYRDAPRVFQAAEPIGGDGAKAIAALAGLTSLDLRNNRIGGDGAKAIAALAGLTSLDLGGNEIGGDGAKAIAALAGLTSLDLRGNDIGDDGAKAIAALAGLTSLDLRGNEIGDDGAKAIAALAGLTSLDLRGNEIGDDGAKAIAALAGLTSLDLRNNRIGGDGAKAIAALAGLTSLDLRVNEIGGDGAKAIAALAGLTSLDLRGNGIGADGAKAILDTWSKRADTKRLRSLDLRENGDLSTLLPDEVLANRSDPRAILAAYRRFREGDTEALNEAKLLVVGKEWVGKTSLIRFLIDDEPCDPSEKKTPGAKIREKIEVNNWSPEAAGIRLNVWDFGGQEIYYETHRFFLTARSLYLVVVSDREEDDRSVFHWLKTIRNRAPGSPVLVVINKSDEGKPRGLRLDEPGLQEAYPEIIGFLRTSCEDNDHSRRSIEGLRQQIVDTVVGSEQLKHVRDPIPAPWLQIKDVITELASASAVLPLSDFQKLCEEGDGVIDADEQRSLLRLLHDLGTIIAHGLEPDARAVHREITLLDPNWLTDAIYTILTSTDCAELQGRFAVRHLHDWLDPATYPEERFEFILDMMLDEEIGLCFPLPGDGERDYLIPEALPASPTYLGEWPADCLRFRYRYALLPRGLVPRFIVQAHDLLANESARWRAGAVFDVRDCPILVQADLDQRQLDIQVKGPVNRRREALGIIRDRLEAIHKKNPEAAPTSLVPLPDQPELDYSYDHLLTLEGRHGSGREVDPEGADRSYTVAELLNGIRPEPTPGSASRATRASVWLKLLESPRAFPIACALAAGVLVALLNVLPPSNGFVLGLAAAASVATYYLVSKDRTKRFYQSWIGWTLFAGLAIAAGGITFDGVLDSKWILGSWRWDSNVSPFFYPSWAFLVAMLIWREWKHSQS